MKVTALTHRKGNTSLDMLGFYFGSGTRFFSDFLTILLYEITRLAALKRKRVASVIIAVVYLKAIRQFGQRKRLGRISTLLLSAYNPSDCCTETSRFIQSLLIKWRPGVARRFAHQSPQYAL